MTDRVVSELAPGAAPEIGESERVSGRFEPRLGLLTLLVSLTAIAVMVPSLEGPYIYDDVLLIEGNSLVQGFEHWRSWLVGTLWDSNYDPSLAREARPFWRPLVLASYALNWELGGGSPFAFHATNMLVHALNAGLLFHVLRGWAGAPWAALAGALVFALHPVQTEPVAWIAGRTDALCTLGLLVAVLGLRKSRRRRALGLLWLLCGVLVAFGAKETAVLLVIPMTIERWSWDRAPLDTACITRLLRASAPYLALALVYFVLHRLAFPDRPGTYGLTAANRPLLVLESIGRYTALLVWPDDLTLGRAMLRYEADVIVPRLDLAALGAVTLLVSLVVAWRARTEAPALSLGLLAYLGCLLPVSGIVWLGTNVLVSPRFLYVPLMALSLAVSAALLRVPAQRALVGTASVLVALLALSWRTAARAADYASEEAFWREEISHNPYYRPAQSHFLLRETRAKRPRNALTLAYRWFTPPSEAGVPDAYKDELLTAVLSAALALVPDVDTASLGSLQSFSMGLARGESATLRLPTLGLELRVAGDGMLSRAVRQRHQTRLLLISAEAAVRRGDDVSAAAAAREAVGHCDTCWRLLSNAALVLARAGAIAEALSLAERAHTIAPDGSIPELMTIIRAAASWQARREQHPGPLADIGFYGALGAFGRAYQAATPLLESPPPDPTIVSRLAELALRAGDAEGARRLLLRVAPAERVDAQLRELAGALPWSERPLPPDVWLPG